jgi:hypothetical protein
MAEYQEFTEPVDPKTGEPMSEEKRKKYKEALLARENPTSRLIRDLPRASQFLRETVGDVKRRTKEVAGDIGEFGAAAAEGVGEAIKAPFEYRAALATDPKGTMAATKEFGSRVMSGDPEARRQTAEGVSMSMVEPFAMAADAELARQDLAKGDYTGAAISGASVLLPFVSAGWLKTAMRKGDVPSEAAEKVAELERRVDAGEVTDDMQIRRELAMIEDDHMADYYGGSPTEEMGRIQEDNFGPADAGVPDPEDLAMERRQDYYEGITTDMRGTPRGGSGGGGSVKDQADEMQRELDSMSYAGQMESEGQYSADADDLVEYFARKYPEDVFAEVSRRIKAGDKYGSETFYEIADPDDYLTPGRGGRGIDDLEGPSEEEIRSMVAQDQAGALKFGDAEEYAMMMEDMRRGLAQSQQEGVERARARTTRTPGTPAASGKVPEGSSRGERRGPPRERPKKK